MLCCVCLCIVVSNTCCVVFVCEWWCLTHVVLCLFVIVVSNTCCVVFVCE